MAGVKGKQSKEKLNRIFRAEKFWHINKVVIESNVFCPRVQGCGGCRTNARSSCNDQFIKKFIQQYSIFFLLGFWRKKSLENSPAQHRVAADTAKARTRFYLPSLNFWVTKKSQRKKRFNTTSVENWQQTLPKLRTDSIFLHWAFGWQEVPRKRAQHNISKIWRTKPRKRSGYLMKLELTLRLIVILRSRK